MYATQNHSPLLLNVILEGFIFDFIKWIASKVIRTESTYLIKLWLKFSWNKFSLFNLALQLLKFFWQLALLVI